MISAIAVPDSLSVDESQHKVAKGGHFAAWEQPKLFSEEVRAGFRPLRELEGTGGAYEVHGASPGSTRQRLKTQTRTSK